MEQQLNETLGQILRDYSPDRTSGENDSNLTFQTYITIFALNLVHRFPDVRDLNRIDVNVVRSIAIFSAACSRVSNTVWDNVNTTETQQQQGTRRRAA